MDLFNKEKIDKLIKNNNEIVAKYEKLYEKVANDRDKFLWDILDKKSIVEAELAKAETIRDEALKKVDEIQKALDNMWNKFAAEVEKNNNTDKKNNELKLELKKQKNALGGCRTQLAKKIKVVGELEMHIKFLTDILEKHGIKHPTMQQLIDYDRTRKSPFRKDNKNEK